MLVAVDVVTAVVVAVFVDVVNIVVVAAVIVVWCLLLLLLMWLLLLCLLDLLLFVWMHILIIKQIINTMELFGYLWWIVNTRQRQVVRKRNAISWLVTFLLIIPDTTGQFQFCLVSTGLWWEVRVVCSVRLSSCTALDGFSNASHGGNAQVSVVRSPATGGAPQPDFWWRMVERRVQPEAV